jgi:hypothetical protein
MNVGGKNKVNANRWAEGPSRSNVLYQGGKLVAEQLAF